MRKSLANCLQHARRLPGRRVSLICILAVVTALFQHNALSFDWNQAGTSTLAPGILYKKLTLSSPRRLNLHVARIDLRTPNLRLTTTGRASNWVNGSSETIRQTTRDFIRQSQGGTEPIVFAFNAGPWSPTGTWNQATAANLDGLAISNGALVSSPNGAPSLLVDSSGRVLLLRRTATDSIAMFNTAVTGFTYVLWNGVAVSGGAALAPRTGYGLSSDGRYLYILVADGRQYPSLGLTDSEVGSWLLELGAFSGIVMDGGGSSTMAWWNKDLATTDKAVLLNAPVGNGLDYSNQTIYNLSFSPTERFVANNLGVYYSSNSTSDDSILFPANDGFTFPNASAEVYGFETPSFSDQGGSGWVFDRAGGNAGVSYPGNAYYNPTGGPSPDGGQFAYLTYGAGLYQTLSVPNEKTYALTFYALATQLGASIDVKINGVPVSFVAGPLSIGVSSWAKYTSTPVALPAGENTILFGRINNTGGGNAGTGVYIDGVSLISNSPPVFVAPIIKRPSLYATQPLTAELSQNASDPDGDTLNFSKVDGPTWLTVTPTGSLSGTPPPSARGINLFTVSAIDGKGGEATATLHIEVKNNLPEPVPQSVSTPWRTPVSIELGALDADGDSIQSMVAVPPKHGYISGTSNLLTYTPDASFSGMDSIAFFVTDGYQSDLVANSGFGLPTAENVNYYGVTPSLAEQGGSGWVFDTVGGNAGVGKPGSYWGSPEGSVEASPEGGNFAVIQYGGGISQDVLMGSGFAICAFYARANGEGTSIDISFAGSQLTFAQNPISVGTSWQKYTSDPFVVNGGSTQLVFGRIDNTGNGNAQSGVFLDGISIAKTASIAINIGSPTPFEEWKQTMFSPHQLSNSDIVGDLSDPDQDKITNLIEYALRLNPLQATVTGITIEADADPLEITFSRARNASDITYRVEASNNLESDWNQIWTSDSVAYGGGENETELITIKDNFPLSTFSRRFLRLRITKP